MSAGFLRLPCSVVVLSLLLAAPASADIGVRATVGRNQLAVGERFTLSVDVSGVRQSPQPDLGDLDGFHYSYAGTTTHVSTVNGKTVTRVGHRYALTTTRPGRFTLGPFSVEVDGDTYKSNAVTVQVGGGAGGRPAGQAAGGARPAQNFRLSLMPAKKRAYVGERVPMTVKLAVGSAVVESVDKVDYPQLATEGFQLDRFTKPAQRSEEAGGETFATLTFRSNLTPLRTGTLALGPAAIDVRVIDSRRSNSRDPFDMNFGFGFNFGRRRSLTVRSRPRELEVVPLPVAGRPAGFSGAIGQFDFTVAASPTELTAGDPITVRMEIRGVGNLTGVESPRVPAGDRLRVYDPLPLKEELGPGRHAVEQVVIPRDEGVVELPAVAFSFFEPEAGEYRTITRGPVALQVASAAGARPRVISDGEQPAFARTPEELGRDIVYLKDRPGRLGVRGRRFYRSAWFAAGSTVPVLGFVTLLVLVRRRDRLDADPRIGRFRAAGRRVRAELAELGREGTGGAGFYDGLVAAMQAYLTAKLDLPPGAIDRQRVAAAIARLPVAATAGPRLGDFFDLVERVRYAGGAASEAERRDALALADVIVADMERERGLERRLTAAAVIAALLLPVLTAVPGAAQEDDPYASFFEGNAAYKEGRYGDAIERYRELLDLGVESGPVYFNLGNAYFKEGRAGEAVLNYERARRWLPRDPDLRANLAFARERLEIAEPARPFWQRLVFPFADRASGSELAVALMIAWALMWGLLAARLLLPRMRAGLTQAAWAAGLVTAVVGSSFAMRLATVDLPAVGVVIADRDAPIRYEPAPTGVEHFRAPTGSMLEITGEREGWYKVRRPDGLRGWVSSEAVGRL